MDEEEMLIRLIDRDEFLDVLYKNCSNRRVMKFDKALQQIIVAYNNKSLREKSKSLKNYVSKAKIKVKIEELEDTKLLGGKMLKAFNESVIEILQELLEEN